MAKLTTYETNKSASFNLHLLNVNIAKLQSTDIAAYNEVCDFLFNNSIYDTRISANEDTCKSVCLPAMPIEHQHILFESINYKTLFNIHSDQEVLSLKIKIYNRVIAAFHTATHEGNSNCIIYRNNEYDQKVKEYIPKAITLHVDVFNHLNTLDTKQEKIYKFWEIVDAVIFDERTKLELNNLKTFRGNV